MRGDGKSENAARRQDPPRDVRQEEGNGAWLAEFKKTELEPKWAVYLDARGRIYARKKEYDKALADADAALRLNPKSAFPHELRAGIWYEKKEYDKAIANYTEVIHLDPKSATAFSGRAVARGEKKQYAEALADFEEVRRLDPKNDFPIASMAWLLATAPDAQVRDGKRAVELAKKALDIDPMSAAHMDTLAAAYAEIGNFEEAVRCQERAFRSPNLIEPSGARRRLELYRKMQPYRQE